MTVFRRRLYFMDSTVKTVPLYGVEIWEWKRREAIEKIQSRYVKASMRLGKNTPDHIWKMEAGRRSTEIAARRRVGAFTVKLLAMEEYRWARKCIKEEIRNIRNSRPTNWGRSFEKAMENMGDGQIIRTMGKGKPLDTVAKRLVELETIAEAQDIQKDWTRIEQSSYCRYYKEIKEITEMETYWQKKKFGAFLPLPYRGSTAVALCRTPRYDPPRRISSSTYFGLVHDSPLLCGRSQGSDSTG